MSGWATTLAGAAWLVWTYGDRSGVGAFRSLIADGVVWLAAAGITAVATARALRRQ
jgi:hypothetical protein